MIAEILILGISYLLGSIPFGFLFSKLYHQNPLQVGWKKTSASNVYKNVGKIPGILTGICDVLKGFLAPKLAQILNFSPQIQVLCAFLAVLGHNWSIFLKFAGGRGIGTLGGALLFFSPYETLLAFVPTLFLALVFDSSLATIFFLFYSIYLSSIFNTFETAGLFVALCLFPVFIKRLSPLKEIFSQKRLILPRLLFDDNQFHRLRIFKILKKVARF